MFTLKFESDARCGVAGQAPDAGNASLVVQAAQYRTLVQPYGGVDVLIENANGVEISHIVDGSLGSFDRCYVMNQNGATVDRIKPKPRVMPSGLSMAEAAGTVEAVSTGRASPNDARLAQGLRPV